MRKVSIIGAGVSGLSAAILLANEGFDVTIYEKKNRVGGNFSVLHNKNYTFELGPVFFNTSGVLESVFQLVGRDIADYLEMMKFDKHTHVYLSNGVEFYFTKDKEKMIEQLTDIDPFGAANYEAFIDEVERIYLELNQLTSNIQLNNWSKLLKIPLRNMLLKLRPYESLEDFLKRYFENEELIQLLARYTNRENLPIKSIPAFNVGFLYTIINSDVYYVKGGAYEVPKALEKLALELGVKMYFNKEISKVHIENNKVIGIQINHKLSIETSAVVISTSQLLNDVQLIDSKALRNEKSKWMQMDGNKLSQFVLLLGLKDAVDLDVHSILFSTDPESEAKQLHSGEFPKNPTIYIYNPAAVDGERFPNGSSIMIISAVPNIEEDSVSARADIASYRYKLIELIKRVNINLEDLIVEEIIVSPNDLKDQFLNYKGLVYGMIATTFAAAYIKPPVESEALQGLYFTLVDTSHPTGAAEAIQNGIHLATRIIDNNKIEDE